jgi:hypothetical protein
MNMASRAIAMPRPAAISEGLNDFGRAVPEWHSPPRKKAPVEAGAIISR